MYAVLIPSLNPNEKLITLIKELKELNIKNIFVVNDGSSSDYDSYFKKCEKLGCVVFRHKVNMGKGAALKTGIKNINDNYKDINGVVTADSDGQHSAKDIKRMLEELENKECLILGTRNLKDKKVPLTSKIGNAFSTGYFKITSGIYLKDTQTGLRGIPKKYFDYSLSIEGERFEYEMNYLEQMSENKIEFVTIDIDTIYDEDRTTHFRFVKDSIKIYKNLLKNIIVATTSAIIDVSLFYILNMFGITVFISSIIARIISGIYNFTLSKIWTFEKKKSNNTASEAYKYLILFILQMIISSSLTAIIENIFNLKISIVIIKIIIDLIIFFINFTIMKKWVFKSKRKE